MATRCFLVLVSAPDLDPAYRTFSTLVGRCLPLAPGDKLKAEIAGAIEDSQRGACARCQWRDAAQPTQAV